MSGVRGRVRKLIFRRWIIVFTIRGKAQSLAESGLLQSAERRPGHRFEPISTFAFPISTFFLTAAEDVRSDEMMCQYHSGSYSCSLLFWTQRVL